MIPAGFIGSFYSYSAGFIVFGNAEVIPIQTSSQVFDLKLEDIYEVLKID